MNALFERNLGLIDERQQADLQNARVAVCGTGGMGGVCAEVLVRMGVGHLTLVDHDHFEASNCNRQIHSNQDSLGRNKAEVLAEAFQRINPEIDVRVFTQGVTAESLGDILDGVEILVNGMDDMRASLMLERRARAMGKTIVDAWLTPYASVFVMKPDSPHWEEYMDLPTLGVPTDALTDELCAQALRKEVDYTFSYGDPDRHLVDPTLKEEVLSGRRARPSLAPIVWLCGVMMANEVFKLVVGMQPTDHIGVFYDHYEHRLLERRQPESA